MKILRWLQRKPYFEWRIMSRVSMNVQEETYRIYNGSIQAFHCINLSVNTNSISI